MHVTMDIFSGRPNPSWTLSDKEARQLTDRVAGKALAAADAVDGALGFRGYIISMPTDDTGAKAGLPHTFRLSGQLADQFLASSGLALPTISASAASEAGRWLLKTAGSAVDDDLLSYVDEVLQAQVKGEIADAAPKPGRKKPEAVIAAPCSIQNTPYNPGFWNTPSVQPNNNCYNYAMNYRSNTFAQPGRISGHQYTPPPACANVGVSADWDGCRATCSGPCKNVALVIWPGQDYHWYRKHSEGFWGHKPGSTAARNTDNLGRVIGGALTPQNCNRGPYTIFCGYRYSPVGMQVK